MGRNHIQQNFRKTTIHRCPSKTEAIIAPPGNPPSIDTKRQSRSSPNTGHAFSVRSPRSGVTRKAARAPPESQIPIHRCQAVAHSNEAFFDFPRTPPNRCSPRGRPFLNDRFGHDPTMPTCRLVAAGLRIWLKGTPVFRMQYPGADNVVGKILQSFAYTGVRKPGFSAYPEAEVRPRIQILPRLVLQRMWPTSANLRATL